MGGLACKGAASSLVSAFRRLHSGAVWAHRFRVFGYLLVFAVLLNVVEAKGEDLHDHLKKDFRPVFFFVFCFHVFIFFDLLQLA